MVNGITVALQRVMLCVVFSELVSACAATIMPESPKPVTGGMRFTLSAPEAKTVYVVGSFNGWDPQADLMHPQEDGSFYAKLGLIPGTYEYKFVLNNEAWIQDPQSGEGISDGYWGQNSIIQVKKA